VGGVLVGCLYAPNGNPQPGPKFDYKNAWLARLNAHARSLVEAGVPAVLCGDYNVVPTDNDIYDPKSWRTDALLQPKPRALFRELLAQGWTDGLKEACGERTWTFWAYLRMRWPQDKGLRIDHLLLSPTLAPRLAGAGVDRWVRGEENASDHAPTWVEIGPA
jgi:exodeoxyribonuclease-3